jgi:hypothetical protein
LIKKGLRKSRNKFLGIYKIAPTLIQLAYKRFLRL